MITLPEELERRREIVRAISTPRAFAVLACIHTREDAPTTRELLQALEIPFKAGVATTGIWHTIKQLVVAGVLDTYNAPHGLEKCHGIASDPLVQVLVERVLFASHEQLEEYMLHGMEGGEQ